MASQCLLDYFTGKTCCVTTYCSTIGLILIDLLDVQEREVILWTAGLSMIKVDACLCHYHKNILNKKFIMKEKCCCNPFGLHRITGKGISLCPSNDFW